MAKVKEMSMQDYEARDDAHTLIRAHKIKSDPKRHAKARKMAGTMAKEAQETLAAHQKVASGK